MSQKKNPGHTLLKANILKNKEEQIKQNLFFTDSFL